MKGRIYTLTSPDYPSIEDFRKFPVWCQWHEAEEVPYIQELCDSEEEYQSKFIEPYEKGKENFYPIIENPIPERVFLSIFAEILIDDKHSFLGYLSTDGNEVVVIHVWVDPNMNEELVFFSDSRLLADEENPKAIKKLKRYMSLKAEIKISYQTNLAFSNGKNVSGAFVLNNA